MKNHTGYGTYQITRQIARRMQLEWDMVEQPTDRPLFRNFPFRDEAPKPDVPPPRPPAQEKRPFAA